MENNTGIAQQGTNNLKSLKEAINSESIQTRFRDMLGKKSAGFLSNLMACVQNNDLLQKADVNSIILAAARSAALDLPIDPNLGQAAIIPFNDKKSGKCRAELQIMRDGFVELCLRTGQFEWIVNEPVFDGELVEKNRFTNTYVFDESRRKPNAKIIGYMAAFKLTNGYTKTVYWSVDECKEHGKKYSKTFGIQGGLWSQNFQSMALKGLSLDTIIPTPDGFTTMGELQVGDKIYNALGNETTVIAKSEIKNLPCYEVQFQNGDTVIADEEHRWFVLSGNISKKDQDWSVLTTKELYIAKALGLSVVVPSHPIVEFKEKELLIDPYVLGYWLGNGSRCAATVCCDEDDADEIVKKYEKYYNVNTRHDNRNRSVVLNISSKTGLRNDMSSLKQQLKSIGVWGNKHIPVDYLRGSIQQRLELVRGLCDSDGSIDVNRGRCTFTSTRQELADGLYTILASLGENVTRFSSEARGYGVTTTVFTLQWQPHFNPFCLKRKSDRVRERKISTNVSVKSVIKVDSVPTQCIAVDSGDAREENDLRKSFLVGDGFFVTHNTVLKHLLKKYAPKSIEAINLAIQSDQASFSGTIDKPVPEYIDNPNSTPVKQDAPVQEFQEAEVIEYTTTTTNAMEEK